jgi:hypothetical protein
MKRYIITALTFCLTLVAALTSCNRENELLQPDTTPQLQIRSAAERYLALPPETRLGQSHPYNHYGRQHNQGFRDAVLNTNTRGTFKEWLISYGDYYGEPGIPLYREWADFEALTHEQQMDTLRARGTDELAVSTYETLVALSAGADYSNPVAINRMIDAVEQSVIDYPPMGTGESKRGALGVTSTFRYSYSMHTGQDFEGVDYSTQSWNPVPRYLDGPDALSGSPIWEIILADVLGFFMSGLDWKKGVKASLLKAIDVFFTEGISLPDIFHPSPASEGGTMGEMPGFAVPGY